MLVDDPPAESLASPYASNGPAVFTVSRWKAHKNTSRYWRHLKGLFTSRTARALQQPLACLACTSTSLCIYQQLVLDHILPPGFHPLVTAGFPFEQTSLALSLLLVFRTDASYARWMEALGLWGDVRSTCTDLINDAAIWVKDERLKQLAVAWTTAYCRSLEVYLKPGSSSLSEVLLPVIGSEGVKQLEEAYHRPHFCLQVLSEVVQQSRVGDTHETKMLNAISRMNNMISTSERLLQFPVPLSYTRHTSRFLLMWLVFLPLPLWNDLGWLTIAANVIIAYLLLGIEEIGVQIEEPFSMLPLAETNNELVRIFECVIKSRGAAAKLVGASREE